MVIFWRKQIMRNCHYDKIPKYILYGWKSWKHGLNLTEFGKNTQLWHTTFKKVCTHVTHMSTHVNFRFTNTHTHTQHMLKVCAVVCCTRFISEKDWFEKVFKKNDFNICYKFQLPHAKQRPKPPSNPTPTL